MRCYVEVRKERHSLAGVLAKQSYKKVKSKR
jgi:hypothetical protein